MKVGIDSYCYHRFFGEHYPQQKPAPRSMTLEDFLRRAHELGVDGVSLESCYIDRDPGYLRNIRAILDEYKLDRIWAWGHREGLEGGSSERAYAEMIAHLECAQNIGAKVMRVVGSSRNRRNQPHGPQLERLAEMFRRAVPHAEAAGVKLAIENHIDFTADEILGLIESVGSPWLGVTFDTGNFVRLLDDPIKGMAKLAKYTYATHIKDLKVRRGAPADEWYFFSSTPIGDGVVDNEKLVRVLAGAGYEGLLAVEIDFLHPDYGDDEDAAVALSIQRLRAIADATIPETAA
jgi:3-oxoisoapionate decarboxylase